MTDMSWFSAAWLNRNNLEYIKQALCGTNRTEPLTFMHAVRRKAAHECLEAERIPSAVNLNQDHGIYIFFILHDLITKLLIFLPHRE